MPAKMLPFLPWYECMNGNEGNCRLDEVKNDIREVKGDCRHMQSLYMDLVKLVSDYKSK